MLGSWKAAQVRWLGGRMSPPHHTGVLLPPSVLLVRCAPCRLVPRRQQQWRAASGDGEEQQRRLEQPGQQQQAAPPALERGLAATQQRPVDPATAKGRATAIVTGAISIIFGIVYLALVQFLDSRGGELLPPPPEAYEQQ